MAKSADRLTDRCQQEIFLKYKITTELQKYTHWLAFDKVDAKKFYEIFAGLNGMDGLSFDKVKALKEGEILTFTKSGSKDKKALELQLCKRRGNNNQNNDEGFRLAIAEIYPAPTLDKLANENEIENMPTAKNLSPRL